MIPPRLIRTIPEQVDAEVEARWDRACKLHPDWDHVTYRDPIDPAWFPLTAKHWPRCQNGAQFAGLVRLEALFAGGGVYIDSDVELFQPLDSLLHLRGFAGWEDREVVPDAVLGAEAEHPAIAACLRLATERIESPSMDWRTGNGAWSTGPGVTTEILPGRDDFTVLPPDSFYPVHYSHRAALDSHQPAPWTYGMHRWAASWLPKNQRG